jgi:hypothetical protein
MRYLLLIYSPDVDMSAVPAEQREAVSQAYNAFTQEARSRGVMEGGAALEPTSTATTVRVREGRTVVTDGPFAETKEALAGFYLFDVKDLDEALEFAARIPGAQEGSIEVRPIREVPG